MPRHFVNQFTKSQSGRRRSTASGRGTGKEGEAWSSTRRSWRWPLLAALFAVGSVIMSAVVGPKRYNRAKLDSYECGIEPTPQPVGGGRFPVKYYITAMLFIVFDIEIVFLYPWAVHFDALKFFGLVEMVLFIATVFVAYAYVWRRGGLEWD